MCHAEKGSQTDCTKPGQVRKKGERQAAKNAYGKKRQGMQKFSLRNSLLSYLGVHQVLLHDAGAALPL